jgi:S-adenosylmethionine hydrolase
MGPITLITDFGIQDYYAALLKGAILREVPTMQLIDITHDVLAQDIMEASFFLKSTYNRFPKGTIHIIAVNSCYSPDAQFLFFEKEGYYFIGPNNGIFSLVFDDLSALNIRGYPNAIKSNSIYTSVANIVSLLQRDDIAELGEKVTHLDIKINLQAVITAGEIRATIIFVDRFGNVIVNLNRDTFEKVRDGRDFVIHYKRKDPITKISKGYGDVPIGDICAFFNEIDHLEIAINMGNAHELLSLNKNEMIQINFF